MPWLDTMLQGISLQANINPGSLTGHEHTFGAALPASNQHLDHLAQSVYGLHRMEGTVIHPEDADYDPNDPHVRTRPRETDEQLRARIAYVASGPPLRRVHQVPVNRYRLSDSDRLDARSINLAFGRHVVNDVDPINAHVLNLALGFEAFHDGDSISASSVNEAIMRCRWRAAPLEGLSLAETCREHQNNIQETPILPKTFWEVLLEDEERY